MTILNPYLSFRGNAREAMTFYQSVFGGDLRVDTFGEGGMSQDPAEVDLVMHAQLATPSGLNLMGSDTPARMDLTVGDNVSVSLSGEDEAELRSFWDGLVAGGIVTMPLERAPWGDTFGMCIDRFGIHWMVNATVPAG
ncbi:VOC family protein [Lacisediminihabitans sp. FW035]